YGFEIESDSLNWNDYLLADIKEKWVMILREDPEPENMYSPFIPFSGDRSKVTLAKDKGAAGVLLVNGVNASKKDEPLELSYDQNLSDAGIPVLSITRKVANKILGETANIEELEKKIIKSKKSIVINSKTIIDANVHVKQERATAKNVAFSLKSSKAKSEKYIIVGAHYDHLGMGGSGTSTRTPDTIAIHNGADDNASGVAGIIELAGKLASQIDSMNHNFIFVAFDAEEMGILGSKYFSEHLPLNKENILAMINFDMIGRMKHDTIGISIGGTGTALEFDSLLNSVNTSFAKNFSPDGYGPSDHASFYSNNIPVLFFSTGAHEDYHTPADDFEKIDTNKVADIMNYAAAISMNLATNFDSLNFQSTGSPIKTGQRGRLKVTLGIIPDFSGMKKNGLGIDGVRKGGPADKGGILKGDKITAINGEKVTNIYDYMFRLSKLKPETTAIIEIERNNKKEVLLIQL
ncbi:MAG: M28 family peptidase, partial [Salinivirgaceae bacterium]|nr:M28 family peptidase [Salinivirgaceae bacterium]